MELKSKSKRIKQEVKGTSWCLCRHCRCSVAITGVHSKILLVLSVCCVVEEKGAIRCSMNHVGLKTV